MVKQAVVVLLVLTGSAWAAANNFSVKGASQYAVLDSSHSGTGDSTNTIECDGAAAMDVTYVISGTCTVTIEGAIDNTTYVTVTGSSSASSTRVTVPRPNGLYHTHRASCTGTATTAARCVFDAGYVRLR